MALTDSLSGLASTCVDIIRSRVELLGLDLEDALWRVAVLISVSLSAAIMIVCATLFAALAFVTNYWATDPVWALLVVGTSYLIVGTTLLVQLVRWFSHTPFLMRESLNSLHRDRQVLANRL